MWLSITGRLRLATRHNMTAPHRLAARQTQALETLAERIAALEAQVAALVALLEKQQAPAPPTRKDKGDANSQ